jgi:hypothetical protein
MELLLAQQFKRDTYNLLVGWICRSSTDKCTFKFVARRQPLLEERTM